MPIARILLRTLVAVGVAVLPGTDDDSGGATAGDPSVWPGDDSAIQTQAPGLLGELPGELPGLLPEPGPLPAVTTTTVAGKTARLRSDG